MQANVLAGDCATGIERYPRPTIAQLWSTMVFRKNDPYNELDATRGAHPPPLLFISGERCSRESRGRSTVLSVNSLSPESRGGAAARANLTRIDPPLAEEHGNGNWRGYRKDRSHQGECPHRLDSLWLDSITWPSKYGVEVITAVLTFRGEPSKLVSSRTAHSYSITGAPRKLYFTKYLCCIVEFQRHLAVSK